MAPALTIELADAKKLNAVVMTESPGFTPAATSASHKASVPDEHPTAYAAPVSDAISLSSASTSGPRMNPCESHTRAIVASTSSRIVEYCRFRSSSGIGFEDPVVADGAGGVFVVVEFTGPEF